MGAVKAILALSTGDFFQGRSFGAEREVTGEVVFCTALTGYQEILTDPSYQGQIVVMTYPHIGNYGMDPVWDESRRPFLAGFVAREFNDFASHWRPVTPLSAYLKTHGVVALDQVDTRALTRILRTQGACSGVIGLGEVASETLVSRAKAGASMAGQDLVREVTCDQPYDWNPASSKLPRRVAVLDFGVKLNILRMLAERHCQVRVFPASASVETILSWNPDGVMLSNGPGDPAAVTYGIDTVRKLAQTDKGGKPLPVFGICLGHQLLGLALGGKTFKLKFGHRGANHPVKDLTTGKVEVTTQNHGFAVDPKSLDPERVEVTHLNLNDGTVEGLRHRQRPVFSVQYHPEASPGPHDAHYLFERFMECLPHA